MLNNIAPFFWLYIVVFAMVFWINRSKDQARAEAEFSIKLGIDFLNPDGLPPRPVYVKTTRRLLKESVLPSFGAWLACVFLYFYVS